jgi:hypothetical protein
MLEKRVKSRFSHRIIRVSPPAALDSYMSLVHATMAIPDVPEVPEVLRLQATPKKKGKQHDRAMHENWRARWKDAVEASSGFIS